MEDMSQSDSETQRDVQQELEWDRRVTVGVGVRVNHGVVTLVGKTDTYAKKVAARDAAHRVAGVVDVVDELEVEVRGRSFRNDAEIAQAVRQALIWDACVPDEKIASSVSGGWVTLEGEVDHACQLEDAVRVVERLNGVRGVTNRICVRPAPIEASRIRASIQAALDRQADWEAKRLEIQVSEGVVRIDGRVRSWSEKSAVERVALHAPGVRRVQNHIVVDPGG